MTLAEGIVILFILGAIVALHAHGYPNTIDAIAWKLHTHAKRTRKMHDQRTAMLEARWVHSDD